jgi:hypothetical protein
MPTTKGKTKPAAQAKSPEEHKAALIDRAHKWAALHRNPKTRDKMDDVLADLSKADQRRVYLCGQRIAGGLSARLAN